ncbi:hypothetical protein [Kribbella sp. NPDC004536]|uniref:hypothetical protein n=1 Tax=Kribbella sp. NPDC004536 TaxID=3364106 RepID=UPI0036CA6501
MSAGSGGYAWVLSEDQIRGYVQRCPAEHRWAFEGWLRGERQLDGDPIDSQPEGVWKVQLWLGNQLIEEHIGSASSAQQHASYIRQRIDGRAGRRLTCERVQIDETAR